MPDQVEQPVKDERLIQAFDVLIDSLRELSGLGRAPTASEVRLEMKRQTYGGFSPSDFGYKRFRDFLADAESHNRVVLDNSRPGDISVLRPGQEPSTPLGPKPIRTDLWKAFVDWSPDLRRVFDLDADKARIFPVSEAPLEPSKFRELRSRILAAPDRFVDIEPISSSTQIEWMKDFAERQNDAKVRSLLLSALSDSKPIKVFNGVLREFPGELVEWRSQFRANVGTEIERWWSSSPSLAGYQIYREHEPGGGQKPSTESADAAKFEPQRFEEAVASAALNIRRAFRSGLQSSALVDWTDRLQGEPELRQRLHTAIDRMPLDELRRIEIPVGYLFVD